MKTDRRTALAGLGGLALLSGWRVRAQRPSAGFIRREGIHLTRDSEPYRIVGANLWYAAWLGADAAYGNRPRLIRELDRLQALGVNNLRIMAAAEEGPLRGSIKPGFSTVHTINRFSLGIRSNDDLDTGLDFAMREIAKRGMTAVLCLGNFWEWSGGFATLLYWSTRRYIDMNDPAHPWPAYPDATSDFYSNGDARDYYWLRVKNVVARYRNNPAVMSWQLANEPRPGGSDAAVERNLDAYYDWIDDFAGRIRRIDSNHLVSLGHEGTMGANGREDIVRRAHENIDYLTAHIWPLNWSWVDGKDLAGTWPAGRAKVADYLATHERLARELGKPLVIEEFGFPRDGEVYTPGTPTSFREQYYAMIYDAVERSWQVGGPVMGSNFWAWNGEARAAHGDARFRDGDLAYMGDPPHEPQGWYGLFDSDESILAQVREHAARRAAGMMELCAA